MIDVGLGTGRLGHPKASYELGISGPLTSIVVEGYEDDTYEYVALGMCRALALLGFRGEVRLFYDGGADEEKKAQIFDTIERLKGMLQITPEDAERIADEELQYAEAVISRSRKMASVIQQEGLRRGLTKEEREKLTLEDVLGPQETE